MKKFSLAEKRRNKKRKLYKLQNGLCCYCSKRMELILIPYRLHQRNIRKRPLEATFEHLDDKFNSKRGTYVNEKRIVLACYACNELKSQESQKRQLGV